MIRPRLLRLFMVLICGGVSAWWGCSLGWTLARGPMDFQAIYYGSRTLLLHHNPYSVSDVEQTYRIASTQAQTPTAKQYENMTLFVNTPGALLVVAPFALLPLIVSQVLWMVLGVGSFCLAAFLVWDVASTYSPLTAGIIICFMLLNCQIAFGGGNTAVVVVAFCTLSSLCFLNEKYVLAGIFCMAISLLIKPHDSGLVWLYFLITGGNYRKRALQSALVSAALAILAIVWVSIVVPHWFRDWQRNLAVISSPGGINDPRPDSVATNSADGVISLQSVFGVFTDNPHFYNSATYLLCGFLLLIWISATLRTVRAKEQPWLALAVIVPLTLLITYHRVHDAKLLLLTIPACAMLWNERSHVRWIALILTSAGIIATADVPLAVKGVFMAKLELSTSTLYGQLLTVLIGRLGQLVLLGTTFFYMWIYLRNLTRVSRTDITNLRTSGLVD